MALKKNPTDPKPKAERAPKAPPVYHIMAVAEGTGALVQTGIKLASVSEFDKALEDHNTPGTFKLVRVLAARKLETVTRNLAFKVDL